MKFATKALLALIGAASSLNGALAQNECFAEPCCASVDADPPCPLGATEGPIQAIEEIAGGVFNGAVKLQIMGVTVIIPLSSFTAGGITSGSGIVLTPEQVLDTAPLPGRIEPGFLGATAKCEVADIDPNGDLTGVTGQMVGRSCILEAAENVLLGLVTETTPDCGLRVGNTPGVPVVRVVDDPLGRYAFVGATDTEGEYSILLTHSTCCIKVRKAVNKFTHMLLFLHRRF